MTLTALSLVLLVLNLRYPNAPIPNYWLLNVLVVIDVTVGAIVASRRPENPVGWLLCLSGVAVSMSTFTSLYAIYALLARPGSLPAGEASAWIAAWLLPIMIGLRVFYLLLFPTGRLPSRRWRWFAYAVAIFAIATTLYVITIAIEAPVWFEWAANAILTAAGTTIPISIGIAILRYRLYDIDTLINRTLVYGSLTVTLVTLYFGGIVVLQRIFVFLTGQQSTLAVVASTLVIAALFTPLRGASKASLIDASTVGSTMQERPWKPSLPSCATRRTCKH